MKILIIEDDQNILDVYKDEFIHEKFEVDTANGGKEGLEKMKSFVPDMVLLDLSMPEVTGFDVLKQVKADPALAKVPVFVLTNMHTDVQDLVNNYGATDVFIKVDLTPGQLVEKIKKHFSM